MLRIDRRLIDRILDETLANEAIRGIGQYIWPRNCDAPEFGLTRPELNFDHYLTYVGTVGNGGHMNFFLNPSGSQSGRTLTALDEMGLDILAGILGEACAAFAGGVVPSDRGQREAVLDALRPETLGEWDLLDRLVWKRNASTDDLVLQYLRANRDQLLRPETV